MPRYRFNLLDHKLGTDQDGQDLSDDVAAMVVADELAKRLYNHNPKLCSEDYCILAINEAGAEIYRVAIRPPINA